MIIPMLQSPAQLQRSAWTQEVSCAQKVLGTELFRPPGTRTAVGKSPEDFQGRPKDVLDLLWYRPKEYGVFKLHFKNQLTALVKR